MTLDQPALLEVLDTSKAAEVDDRIRQAAETIYKALIEAMGSFRLANSSGTVVWLDSTGGSFMA